jgi:uncharacterized protein
MEKDHVAQDKDDKIATTTKPFRILSISGGGSRGIIPSIVLLRLEQMTGRHATELFDLFVGTSTGAMISAVLNIPDSVDDIVTPQELKCQNNVQDGQEKLQDGQEKLQDGHDKLQDVQDKLQDGQDKVKNDYDDVLLQDSQHCSINPTKSVSKKKWKYSAKDLLDVYIREGPIVFEGSLLRKWYTINGLYGHLYDTRKRDERFKAWMGETRLKDLLSDVILTSYERCTRSPVFFKSRKARSELADDHPLLDCVKAATAAPTVWPYHPHKDGLYMDALYGKNPSMFGVVEALHHYNVEKDNVLLMSLGTGFCDTHTDSKKVITSGTGFLLDAFDSTVNANTKSTMYMVKCLLKENHVLDIDIPITEQHLAITDVSTEHIEYLIDATHKYLDDHHSEIVEFAKRLVPESQWISSNFQK